MYEAGPCGFWICREITALGERCMVVSPALVPRRAGGHVKTDRRDSERLADLARAGELEPIHVPDMTASWGLDRTANDIYHSPHPFELRRFNLESHLHNIVFLAIDLEDEPRR